MKNALLILLGILIGAGGLTYLSWRGTTPVTLVKTWSKEDMISAEATGAIGNGLYRAIAICMKHNGITSVEGNYLIDLVCHANGKTYELERFEWIGDEKLQ